MAQALIIDKKQGYTKNIKDFKRSTKIKELNKNRRVSINEVLPFRIKFSSITVPGYGPSNVPPIGIAIIGFNNYIL